MCDISELTHIVLEQELNEQGWVLFIDDQDIKSKCFLLRVIRMFAKTYLSDDPRVVF